MDRNSIKALVLTRYESKGASSRIRLLQFVPTFEKLMLVQVQSLFSNSYVDRIGKRFRLVQFVHGLLGLVKRAVFLAFLVLKDRKFDVVILQQELFPFVPAQSEIWILRRLTKQALVIDIDDGNQIRYRDGNRLKRGLCGSKLQQLWSVSDLVVCGSRQLVEDVSPHLRDDGKAVLIPSVPALDLTRIKRRPSSYPPYIIGWIGSPSTASDLSLVWGPLQQVAEKFPIEIHIVGVEIAQLIGLTIRSTSWSALSESELLSRMDVGIMPLSDNEFRRRKCGFKIVQYMSAGIPVIASDVGGNQWIMIEERRAAGLVVKTSDEWIYAFENLLGNEDLRRQRGEEAAEIARDRFSLPVAQELWTKSLKSLPKIGDME